MKWTNRRHELSGIANTAIGATPKRLPQGFDYERAELAVRHPSTQWAAEGVQAIDGQPLPALDGASILVPAGVRGPAFLVGANFRVLLRYNNSTNYDLAVSLLASQLAGNGGVSGEWPRELGALTRDRLLIPLQQPLQGALVAQMERIKYDAGSCHASDSA